MKINYYPDFNLFYKNFGWIITVAVLSSLYLGALRATGLSLLGLELQALSVVDFVTLFFEGFRYDIATVLRAFYLFLLTALFGLFLPVFLQRWISSLVFVIGLIILFLAIFLGVGNLAYLVFFGTPYDEFIIEALMFDWQVIIAGMAGAGTSLIFVVVGLFAGILLVWISTNIYQKARKITPQIHVHYVFHVSIVIVSMLLISVLARGTLSTFPLGAINSAVTSSADLNKLVLNGPFALYVAAENYATSANVAPTSEADGRLAYQQYFGREPNSSPVFEQFFIQTPLQQKLEDEPPHVFLGIVESLSSSMLDESYTGSEQLAQRLNKHFDEDGWFSRFTPAHNFTQGSIANILTGLNYPIISQSRHRRFSLDTAAAKVYQRKGYRTIYIYSGFESVRNGGSYYLRQGFDEFIGTNALLKHYPEMPLGVWGGEDYYAFDYALRTYHYTSEVLGDFLDYVKQGELSGKTIVALTGDHGVRGALSTSATDLFTKAVPFYLYVPDDYKPEIEPDLQTLGSHRDIMPTLYNLSLSEANYPNLGNNLYTLRDETNEFAVLHHNVVTNEG